MEVPLLLQFSIALFTGMVAATFVPPVRKAIPRALEVFLWVALVAVCVVAVTTVADPNARELSAAAAWGADQVINTVIALAWGGFGAWIGEHRFPIASWLVIIAGADIFALMFLNSMREGRPWQPGVRLRDWMELPIPAAEPAAARRKLVKADPLGDVNRRLAAATAVAGTAALTGSIQLSIWMREVVVPRQARRIALAAAAGRERSRTRLDSLREVAAHLRYAAGSWYVAAGRPAIISFAKRTAAAATRNLKPVALKPGEVVDIQALLGAQSIGWYGPLSAGPAMPPGDNDAAEPQRSDRLAS